MWVGVGGSWHVRGEPQAHLFVSLELALCGHLPLDEKGMMCDSGKSKTMVFECASAFPPHKVQIRTIRSASWDGL